jgi:hypothetical protein
MDHLRNIILSSFILLAGCMSVRVYTESKEGFYLNDYTTYKYNEDHYNLGDTNLRMNQELAYFKDRFDEKLQLNGLHIAEEPELLLNLDVVYVERRQTRSGGDPGYDKNYAGDIRPDRNRVEFVTVNYEIETLTVEFVDVRKNEIVFHGNAFGMDAKNDRKIKERIDATVGEMFLEIPKK